MLTGELGVAATGIEVAALKPKETSVKRAAELPISTIAIDYEGRDHLPDPETLRSLAETKDVYLTTPVRADGFDPLGDDSLVETIPETVRRVLVAGHGAYLSASEADRAIAPRIGAARRDAPNAWIGTEGIERIALAAGGTQYELLSRSTVRTVRALKRAGYDDDVAVYAPTVLSEDEDEILDAVGPYTARRGPVRRALPDGAATDSTATGRAREILSKAVRDYALIGTHEEVRRQVERLTDAGVDAIVGYPARGIDEFLA
ncbi:MAG: DUF7388 family protein [Halobacteriota archaeon]